MGCFRSLSLILLSISGCYNISIEKIEIPELVAAGENAELICKAKLDAEESNSGLTIHWYFTPSYKPTSELDHLFQWIIGYPPAVVHKETSELTCNITDDASLDIEQETCGVRLLNVDSVNSGRYTCVVSTFQSEKREHRTLTAYSKEAQPIISIEIDNTADGGSQSSNDDEIQTRESEESKMWFVCNASDVHPEPSLKLFVNGKEAEHEQEPLNADEQGRYNASSRVKISELRALFRCELSYPSVPSVQPAIAEYDMGEGERTTTEVDSHEDESDGYYVTTESWDDRLSGTSSKSSATLFVIVLACLLFMM